MSTTQSGCEVVRGIFFITIFFIMSVVASLSSAEELFFDNFEANDLSHSQSGISWGESRSGNGDDVSITSSNAMSGSKSLRFLFGGNQSLGDDAWAEQRLHLGQSMQEVWIKFKLFVPQNYEHRHISPSNNKFLAIYCSPYSSRGFQVNFSLEPNSAAVGSQISLHYYYKGVEKPVIYPRVSVIGAEELGKWNEVTVHVATPSGDTADGVMQLWMNGEKKVDMTVLNSYGGDGQNYFNELYLMGWANSGFNQDTSVLIDDMLISTTLKPQSVVDFKSESEAHD